MGIVGHVHQLHAGRALLSAIRRLFEQTRISLQKWLILIYWWVREYSVTDAMEEAEVSKHVAVNVYQWLCEIC